MLPQRSGRLCRGCLRAACRRRFAAAGSPGGGSCRAASTCRFRLSRTTRAPLLGLCIQALPGSSRLIRSAAVPAPSLNQPWRMMIPADVTPCELPVLGGDCNRMNNNWMNSNRIKNNWMKRSFMPAPLPPASSLPLIATQPVLASALSVHGGPRLKAMPLPGRDRRRKARGVSRTADRCSGRDPDSPGRWPPAPSRRNWVRVQGCGPAEVK